MFEKVIEKHKKVIIIAGGESFRGFDLKQLIGFDGAVIAVNNAILHLPRADYWITVDPMDKDLYPQLPMRLNKDISNKLFTKFYCAFPDLTKIPDAQFYKKVEGVHYLERISLNDKEKFVLQEDKDKITSIDSTYGALGLAYHFGATKIAIFGLDGYGHGHWYDKNDPYNGHGMPSSWFMQYKRNLIYKYRHCLPQLNKRHVKVYNGSKDSKIDAFPRYSPQEAFKLLF